MLLIHSITISQVRSWIMSIIDAITYMHDMDIIHRDIKVDIPFFALIP